MTGGSLGIRAGSYGSLLNIKNVIAGGGRLLHSKSFGSVRKNPIIMLSGSREKERSLPSIWYRYLGRRNFSMLLLVAFAVLFFVLGSFVVNKACPVCYLPVDQAIASMPSSPSESPVLHNLTYVHDENPIKTEPHGGSDFGGYPSLKQRNDSFDIKESMVVHCGVAAVP